MEGFCEDTVTPVPCVPVRTSVETGHVPSEIILGAFVYRGCWQGCARRGSPVASPVAADDLTEREQRATSSS